jgi:hypothetical protein
MTNPAELKQDQRGEAIVFPSKRFLDIENAANDLRSMASINENLIEQALDYSRSSRDDNGMLQLHFSDDWIRDLLFAAYDIRRRTSELFDHVDGISREAFDARK